MRDPDRAKSGAVRDLLNRGETGGRCRSPTRVGGQAGTSPGSSGPRGRWQLRARHASRRALAFGALGRAGQLPQPCGCGVARRGRRRQAPRPCRRGATALHALRQGGLLLGASTGRQLPRAGSGISPANSPRRRARWCGAMCGAGAPRCRHGAAGACSAAISVKPPGLRLILDSLGGSALSAARHAAARQDMRHFRRVRSDNATFEPRVLALAG